MKIFDILKEEGKNEGIEIAETAIVKVFSVLKSTAARAVVEGEGSEKVIAGFVSTVLMTLDSAVEKLADLNKDGKIG